LAKEIQKYFPPHSIYIEPFFGAGGMFFNKPKVKYNYLNDADRDVYNLFRQVIDNKEELINMIRLAPITEAQFKLWSAGQREKTDLLNAVRFLFLSNFGYLGNYRTLKIESCNPKSMILQRVEKTFDYIKDSQFLNCDFREVFSKIHFHTNDPNNSFCYCDPPFINTDNNYSQKFTEADSFELFEMLQNSGIKWAMSEFQHPFILSEVEKRNLNIIHIGERRNLKNRRSEILITNYTTPQLKLFE
jgi:DNA adenine methylase